VPIEHEHGILKEQIEQLKMSLEEAQLVRRRKIEYDLVAEKVNTLPTRDELEQYVLPLRLFSRRITKKYIAGHYLF
jgi:THO complex subunit 7